MLRWCLSGGAESVSDEAAALVALSVSALGEEVSPEKQAG